MLHNEAKLDRWASELWRYCSNADKKTEQLFRLTLLTATLELDAWLNDSRQYKKIQYDAWISAIFDFNEAVDTLGAHAGGEIASILLPLKAELTHLPGSATTTGMTTTAAAHRNTAKALTTKLLKRIRTLKCLEALWLDLVDDCKNVNVSYEDVDWRSSGLWEVARELGYGVGWGGVSGWMSAILVGDNFYIEQVQRELEGKEAGTSLPENRLLSEAEFSMEQRLTLCRRVLRKREKKTNNVVWFVIDNASMSKTVMELGAITFYDSNWLVLNLFDDGPSKSKLPAELLGKHPGLSKYDFTAAKHRVMARVDLRRSYKSQAPNTAKNMLSAVFTMAGNGGNAWKINGDYHVFTDGMISSSGSHKDTSDLYLAYTDGTAYNLEKLQDDIESVTTKAPFALDSQLQYLSALKSDKDNDPLSSIIVSVRALEQAATWVSLGTDKWWQFTKNYLKSQWCRDQLKRELSAVVNKSLYTDMRFGGSPKMQGRLQKISHKICSSFHDSGYRVDYYEAMKAARAVSNCYKGLYDERELAQIANVFSNTASIDNYLRRVEHSYEMLENRLVRVRNAAAHGGPIVEGVVDSVRFFGHDLAAMAVYKATWSTLENKNLLSAFTKYNQHSVRRHQSIRTGSPRKMILK